METLTELYDIEQGIVQSLRLASKSLVPLGKDEDDTDALKDDLEQELSKYMDRYQVACYLNNDRPFMKN
jgi:predicted amino acid-binding ACT domain protein